MVTLPYTNLVIPATDIEGDYKQNTIGITKFFNTVGTPRNRKFKAASDTIEWPITNAQSPNEVFYIVTVFLVEFWGEK